MTSNRSYRRGMTSDEAVKELLNCAGKFWGLEIVEAFISYLSKADIDLDSFAQT